MSDDIIADLRLEKRELTWRAADEIERFRAELAAEREKREKAQAEIGWMQNHINREHIRYAAERDALRAEVIEAHRCRDMAYAQREQANNEANAVERDCAKLETAHGQNVREIDRLRADLAAERERRQALEELSTGYNAGCAELRADRDALRAELDRVNENLSTMIEIANRRLEDGDTLRAELAKRDELLREALKDMQFASKGVAVLTDVLRHLSLSDGHEQALKLIDRLEATCARIDAALNGGGDGIRAD